MTEPLLKARDVAELLGLEVATVVARFQQGDLPGFRLYGRKGGPLRFRLSEIERWLETRCRPADNPLTIEKPGGDAVAPGTAAEAESDAKRILRPVGRV